MSVSLILAETRSTSTAPSSSSESASSGELGKLRGEVESLQRQLEEATHLLLESEERREMADELEHRLHMAEQALKSSVEDNERLHLDLDENREEFVQVKSELKEQQAQRRKATADLSEAHQE